MIRSPSSHSRRRFLGFFSSIGLSSTLLPGVLWAKLAEDQERKITRAMLADAALVAGLDFTDAELDAMLQGVNEQLGKFAELRKVSLDMTVGLPLAFVPLPPGTLPRESSRSPVLQRRAAVRRPPNLESVAWWPVTDLAQLVRTRQVRSVELTEMYLDRLKRFNPTLNCVVTFTDDLAMQQARQADAEIVAGRYRGTLHGIPWGAKDIIAVRGYRTTWGSAAFKDQVIDTDATVVRLLRDAGAVLVAKLATGELAGGDQWFGGRTNNPWNPDEGSSGSSAGPASATSAGLVGFAVGTETGGSILSPSSVCGATGLRPTFGRVSRYGVMTLSYTQDRVGPLCREAEDCAVVLSAIAEPDGLDFSVSERPFDWNARVDVKKIRVGYLVEGFDEARDQEWKRNDQESLDALRVLGITLIPFRLPDMPMRAVTGTFSVERGAAFDTFVRTRRNAELVASRRGSSFQQSMLVPAVDYLQAMRARGVLVRQLAEATASLDVYVAPYFDVRNARPGGPPLSGAIYDNFNVANLCGYPCIGMPNGFTKRGTPTSITFIGRPYGEAMMVAVAKAYQDATGWHLRHPAL